MTASRSPSPCGRPNRPRATEPAQPRLPAQPIRSPLRLLGCDDHEQRGRRGLPPGTAGRRWARLPCRARAGRGDRARRGRPRPAVHRVRPRPPGRPAQDRVAPVRRPAPCRGDGPAGAGPHLQPVAARAAARPARLRPQGARQPAHRPLASPAAGGPGAARRRRAGQHPGPRSRRGGRPHRGPRPAGPGAVHAHPASASGRRAPALPGPVRGGGRRRPRRQPRHREVDRVPGDGPAPVRPGREHAPAPGTPREESDR